MSDAEEHLSNGKYGDAAEVSGRMLDAGITGGYREPSDRLIDKAIELVKVDELEHEALTEDVIGRVVRWMRW
jgi:hypothetical protein